MTLKLPVRRKGGQEVFITPALRVDFIFGNIHNMTIAEKITKNNHYKKPNGLTAIAWGNALRHRATPKNAPKGQKQTNKI
ncbi:MAG: hypothetical protein P9L91_10970 [Candidatus Zophobacter franzmannii]|nr:hypothetical protein [Candidatus Zophobacter franzmannii]